MNEWFLSIQCELHWKDNNIVPRWLVLAIWINRNIKIPKINAKYHYQIDWYIPQILQIYKFLKRTLNTLTLMEFSYFVS